MNLQRLGRALRVAALDEPRYDGRVNGAFDVSGIGHQRSTSMTLDASGTLTDSSIYGTHTAGDGVHDADRGRGLSVDAKGGFER